MGGFGGDEGADLRQKHDEGGLTKEGGLTAHVRPGDDHDLRLLVVEVHVIRHVALPEGELLLDDGVAPSTDIDDEAIIDDGAGVALRDGHFGERTEAVQLSDDAGILLQWADEAREAYKEFAIETPFEAGDTLFGAEDLLLVLLELGEDVALGVGERLLACPVFGYLIIVGGAHLDVVAEDIIIGDLEGGDTRALTLAALELQEVFLAVGGEATELIQLAIHSWGDGDTTTESSGWLFGQRVLDVGDELAHRLQAAGYLL